VSNLEELHEEALAADRAQVLDNADRRALREALRREFPGQGPAVVDEELTRAIARFSGSRVSAFLPILVGRAARAALRSRPGSALDIHKGPV